MTVDEAIEKLQAYSERGHGEDSLLWMNLNMQEYAEVETIELLEGGSGVFVQ